MKLVSKSLNLLLAACLLLLLILAAVPATATAAAASAARKLGAEFTDYTVPKSRRATVGESLGFVAIVVGVLAVASVNTYFKVKASPKLPGYTQAVYLREREHQ